MSLPTFKSVSDCALLVEFGTSVDDELNRQVIQLDQNIASVTIDGLQEVIPALVNLLLIFDPLLTDHATVQAAVLQLFPLKQQPQQASIEHVINVCYDDEFAYDLDDVASACNISKEAVLDAHCKSRYRVSMYGFAPGYAYLSGVPGSIQVPRKSTAVRDIPAGSVMIAGAQCLITTLKMPTGWSIIGRSDAVIITGRDEQPFLFNVGDTIRFNRVDRHEIKEQEA